MKRSSSSTTSRRRRPQLGRIANDAADPRADRRPVAEVIGAHQLPDPQGERDVGAEPPVGVRRCVVGGRRVGGPNGYTPKMVAGLLEPSQLIPVKSRISPLPPVVPSDGRAPEVGR